MARDDDDEDAPPGIPPRENPDLVGHEHAEQQLARSFRSGRMHHAWLITGPPGIGKATLAFRLARWIFADRARAKGGSSRDSLYVEPNHPVFRMVASGGHPDLRVLKREVNEKTGKMRSEISVEQAREAIKFLHLTPALGGWRIVIVDPVDDLSTAAANSLLKALEEPPSRGLFLLVNHAISRALPTIRSRCQRLVLQPLESAGVAAIVAKAMPDLPRDEVAELARLSEGSPGRALALAASGGLELLHEMQAVLAKLPNIDGLALDRLTEKIARSGEDAVASLRDLLLWWLAERVKAGAASAAPGSLDRWARLWENTARLFERAEAATLDRKQALLEIFYDIQATARAA
jgi:DNA polymerase-3 subunit delta'